jgi:hypothetical protein
LYITESTNNLLNPPKDNLTELVSTIQKLYTNESLTNLDYTKINGDTLPKLKTEKNGNYEPFYSGNYDTTTWGADYNKTINQPSINGIPLVGNKTDAELGIKVEVDTALNSTSKNPVQNKVVNSAINNINSKVNSAVNDINSQIDRIWEEMDGMTYIPLSILSFEAENPLHEIGETVTKKVFTWSLSDTPSKNLLINNVDTGKAVKEGYYELQSLLVTEKENFTLTAEDKKGNKFTAITPIEFANNVFYGSYAITDDYVTMISKLQASLQKTRKCEFTTTAGEGQYIYYAAPVSYGECAFASGGFSGGFTKVANIQYVNAYNKTFSYDIYRSVEAGLGQTTITVS